MITLNSKHQDDALALADELRPVLHRLYRQLRRESEDLNRGVSPLQNLLLAAIIEHPGIGVADLARIEKLRGPTISGHVKRLESAGLVVRAAPLSTDRRRVGLMATARGRSSIEAIKRRRRDWLAHQLGNLSFTARRAIRKALGPLSEIGGERK
jgi:DNA-binding MarR family transcriptional regulator